MPEGAHRRDREVRLVGEHPVDPGVDEREQFLGRVQTRWQEGGLGAEGPHVHGQRRGVGIGDER